MKRETLRLPGLDGSNPLHFMAALGVLRVLHEAATAATTDPPRLAWEEHGWLPVVHSDHDLAATSRILYEDCVSWRTSAVFRFAYPKREKAGVKLFHGVNAPVGAWRAWLTRLVELGDENALAFAASLASESASQPIKEANRVNASDFTLAEYDVDETSALDESTLSTPFDFSSRNAQFLDQARLVGESVTEQLIVEALIGDSASVMSAERTLGWDPAADRPAALYTYWRHPSPVLEWLAFRSLPFFPSFGSNGTLRTVACQGRRKNGTFSWPLWLHPSTSRAIGALLASRQILNATEPQRKAVGIFELFHVELTKAADGYSGVFSPTRVLGFGVS